MSKLIAWKPFGIKFPNYTYFHNHVHCISGSSKWEGLVKFCFSLILNPGCELSFGSMYGLGFAGDFMNGSMNRTFYATHLGSNEVAKYTGNSWVSVANDSNLYHNVAGYGNFLYLQHVATSSVINDQFISRLNSNGTITKIFTDTTLRFTVSDLEIDSAGNIYFFRGPAIGNTTELTVINSAGAIINSYTATASFSNVSTIFGMVFLGKQLYVGQGTTNGQLFPVIISGSTVSL